MSEKLWTNKVTPAMLADALESGDWIKHRGLMSKGVHSKRNCCLGVACRLAGDNKEWNEMFWGHATVSDLFDEGLFAPWLTNALQKNLALINDSRISDSWGEFIIPILREIKVTKKNQLTVKQTPLVEYITSNYIVFHIGGKIELRRWFLDIENGELP